MAWKIELIPPAEKDLSKLDHAQRIQVVKALEKVSADPRPMSEGGYGKPLGNHNGNDLSGLMKIKIRRAGIRIIYRLVRAGMTMKVIVIGMRGDNQAYDDAGRRRERYGL